MSRGHGVVQRFILDYLAAGHPEPDVRDWVAGPRPRRPKRIGHLLWDIAYAYRGGPPDRSTEASFGRAMATLRRDGLIEVRYKWRRHYPHLRIAKRRPSRRDAADD
jgi:hypothetical protein